MNTHTLFNLLQSGTPPLNAEILLWTGDYWLLGEVSNASGYPYLHYRTGGGKVLTDLDRWLILPTENPNR